MKRVLLLTIVSLFFLSSNMFAASSFINVNIVNKTKRAGTVYTKNGPNFQAKPGQRIPLIVPKGTTVSDVVFNFGEHALIFSGQDHVLENNSTIALGNVYARYNIYKELDPNGALIRQEDDVKGKYINKDKEYLLGKLQARSSECRDVHLKSKPTSKVPETAGVTIKNKSKIAYTVSTPRTKDEKYIVWPGQTRKISIPKGTQVKDILLKELDRSDDAQISWESYEHGQCVEINGLTGFTLRFHKESEKVVNDKSAITLIPSGHAVRGELATPQKDGSIDTVKNLGFMGMKENLKYRSYYKLITTSSGKEHRVSSSAIHVVICNKAGSSVRVEPCLNFPGGSPYMESILLEKGERRRIYCLHPIGGDFRISNKYNAYFHDLFPLGCYELRHNPQEGKDGLQLVQVPHVSSLLMLCCKCIEKNTIDINKTVPKELQKYFEKAMEKLRSTEKDNTIPMFNLENEKMQTYPL